MTERSGRPLRRGGARLTASGLVAAATVGVTGVTVAWAFATAPAPGPAQAAQQLAQQLGADEAQVVKLQQTIAAERSQLATLSGTGAAAGSPPWLPPPPARRPATRAGAPADDGGRCRRHVGWGHPGGVRGSREPRGIGQRGGRHGIGRIRHGSRAGRPRGHGTPGHLAPGDRTAGDLTPDHRSPAGHHHDPRLGVRAVTAAAPVLRSTRSMASDITLFGATSTVDVRAVEEAFACFDAVQDACTRFDPESPLMQANARPDDWHRVPPVLLDALRESYRAYVRTGGRFDPRVHDDLVRLGYDRSLRFADDAVETSAGGTDRAPLPPWTPRFSDGPAASVHLGGVPVDLGGIGKTFALRRAVNILRGRIGQFLLDAGGDCYCAGSGPEGDGWRGRGGGPGRWPPADGRTRPGGPGMRHLVDPAPTLALRRPPRAPSPRPGDGPTRRRGPGRRHRRRPRPRAGRGADQGPLPTRRAAIAGYADEHGIAALWVADDGRVTVSPALDPLVVWRAA